VRRAAAALAALLAVVTAAVGCAHSGSDRPFGGAHRWTEHGHLRIGVLRTIDTLNPLLSTQVDVSNIAQLIYSGLIRYDADGNAIPDLAERVPTQTNHDISADGKTITYHLRSDAKFSDGVPVTARDVVFTWQANLAPKNNVPNHFPYDLARSVVARDDRTVVVRLAEPNAAFVAFFMRCGTQGSILPEHLLAHDTDLNTSTFNRAPIGSGPFAVASYSVNNVLELKPNPYWWGPRIGLQRITYRIIPDENSLMVALRTHAIDWYYGAPEQQKSSLAAIGGVRVSARPLWQWEAVTFNTRRAPFDDVRVRRAAARTIDWTTLQQRVYLGVDRPGVTDVFPLSWAADPSVKPYARDAVAAAAELDAAGWVRGADGVRVRDGKRLSVQMRTVNGVLPRINAEVVIQQNLRALGFDVTIVNAPANLLFAPYAASGLLARGNFDLAIYGWTEAPDPADDLQTLAPDSVPPNGANFSGLRDAEIGRLQRRGYSVYARSARLPFYRALQQREHELVPFQTIVWRSTIDAVNDDFHGFKPAVAVSDFWNPWEWSI
jgi:peptide/nickel transport system substrate-binding protein